MRHTCISESTPLTNKECFIIPRRGFTMLFAMHSIFHPGVFSGNQVLIFAILISLRLKIYRWSNTSYVLVSDHFIQNYDFFWRQIAIFDLDYLAWFIRVSISIDRLFFVLRINYILPFTIYLLKDICTIPNIWLLTLKLKWQSIGMLCVFIFSESYPEVEYTRPTINLPLTSQGIPGVFL